MRIDIMTLFPDAVDAMMNASIIGRAQERGFVTIRTHQIREFTTNRQMQVDDYPYGGGRGAVMQADPLFRCWEHVVNTYGPGRTIFMSPCGRTFTQSVARELKAQYDHLNLVCGHYEGIDQRFIDACVDEELSMGDFVLTGGELVRLSPELCWHREVFQKGLDILRTLCADHGAVTLAEVRDAFDTTRKYALLFLEACDRRQITVREGDCRRLKLKFHD